MTDHGAPRERDVQVVRICECGCGGTPKMGRFLKGHYARSLDPIARSALGRMGRAAQPTPSTVERFWPRVRKSEECWEWTGPRNNHGYGTLRHNGRDALAHRVSYELNIGPIPDGLQLDHLCRNRGCVRPDHLEPVTNRENALRGEAPAIRIRRSGACARGHEANAENRYYWPDGRSYCRVCERERERVRYLTDPEFRQRKLATTAAAKARRRARRVA